MSFLGRRVLSVFAAIVCFTSVFNHGQAFAWGKFGHLTVCDVAYRKLTEKSRETLKEILHDDDGGLFVEGRGKLDDRYYTSFNVGCVEEDSIPRRNPEDHFINVPRTTKSIENEVCPVGASCTFNGIERDRKSLADTSKSDDERVFALFAIGHWVADLHQPLHISFKDDRGGNRIEAKVDGKCGKYSFKSDNLHAVWDNCLLNAGLYQKVRESAEYKNSWSRFTITYRGTDIILSTFSFAEEQQIVKSTPQEWANESYQITIDPKTKYCVWLAGSCNYSNKTKIYKKSLLRKETISQDYIAEFKDVAEKRIALAGLRLAHVLNMALDPNYTVPVRYKGQP